MSFIPWSRGLRCPRISVPGFACHPYKTLYTVHVARSKPVEFRGSSLEDMRAFPLAARREAGHQLDRVQNGREPDDWKPMNTVGRGAKEIRIRDEAGAFRVLYVAKFADAIYVLHCFEKESRKTDRRDIEVARERLKFVRQRLPEQKSYEKRQGK